ncbi:hypothetical protein ACFVWC_30100 [Bacillus mycoides]|uniref:hypothetical protein n=1 Tax=Bacillus mycoides TaxID=1405 RepID=UPI0036EC4E23
MGDIEHDLKKYNNLKTDLLSIAKCIDCCEQEDICFYQDLAIIYSERLRKLNDFIRKEYGLDVCANKCLPKDT